MQAKFPAGKRREWSEREKIEIGRQGENYKVQVVVQEEGMPTISWKAETNCKAKIKEFIHQNMEDEDLDEIELYVKKRCRREQKNIILSHNGGSWNEKRQ